MLTRWLWLLVLALIGAAPVTAQDELVKTFIQPGEFAIDYPAGWQVETDAVTGFVYLTSGDVQLTLYSPAVLAAYELVDYNPDSLTRLVVALNAVTAGESQPLDLNNRAAAAIHYENPQTGRSGLLIAREFGDGRIGLVDVFAPAEMLDAHHDLILGMAATFDVPPVPAPLRLEQYAASLSQAVAELEVSGLVPAGGQMVFAEDYVFAAGIHLTQLLAQSLSLADVIVAGTLNYSPSTDPLDESCGMLVRLSGDGSGLEIGIDSDGNLYAITNVGRDDLASSVDVSLPHRVVILALGPRLIVYLDGDLVADKEVSEGSGSFGIRVQGSGPGAACAAREMWVYHVPAVSSSICEIVADGGAVNQRSGPGTAFDIAGVLDAGATATAQAQAAGMDGLTWWQLAGGAWVREDVVTEQGACAALPVGE